MESNNNQEELIRNLESTISNYEKVNQEQNERIEKLEEIISEMNEKLLSLDNLVQENSNLQYQINNQNEIITQKNKLLSEFQELAKVSKVRFEDFMNNNDKNQNELEKKKSKIFRFKK